MDTLYQDLHQKNIELLTCSNSKTTLPFPRDPQGHNLHLGVVGAHQFPFASFFSNFVASPNSVAADGSATSTSPASHAANAHTPGSTQPPSGGSRFLETFRRAIGGGKVRSQSVDSHLFVNSPSSSLSPFSVIPHSTFQLSSASLLSVAAAGSSSQLLKRTNHLLPSVGENDDMEVFHSTTSENVSLFLVFRNAYLVSE